MATISKRTQARNEKVLQELIKTVPGNDRCADCGARNPGWASWSLGIFLCMRCASLHRKLGTHISKVKSLSMDSWSNEQVDSMKRNGNTKTNKMYNPQNSKPPIPLDVDEVDTVLEKFIRQKYDQRLFIGGDSRPTIRQDTGSTRSSDDQPPPLPPKPAKRFGFGFRSASSALPTHSSGPTSPPRSPRAGNNWSDEPLRVNKQSRVFGATVGASNDNMETKLAQLRDMGFTDEKRNSAVLKGLGGNFERTVEQLVRLGESGGPPSQGRTPLPPRNVAVSQPMPATSSTSKTTNGLSFANNGPVARTDTGSMGQQSEPSPVSSQGPATARSLSPSNPYQTQPSSYNPFAPASDQQNGMVSMNQALSNMQLSQQPLFPNATGGYPNAPPHAQDPRLQTMTPPVPQAPHQFTSSNPYMQQNGAYNNNYNPFYQSSQQSSPLPSIQNSPSLQQQSSFPSNNPFMAPNITPNSPLAYQPNAPQNYPGQPQQGSFQPQPMPQQPVQQNGFTMQQPFISPMQNNPYHQQQPSLGWNQYGQQLQQAGRLDKSSILSLYNYPQLAPQSQSNETNGQSYPNAGDQAAPNGPQRSVTMPVQPTAGTNNPFQSSLNKAQDPASNHPGIGRHVSQESVDIGGSQNGRHSPDAFASLSARFVR